MLKLWKYTMCLDLQHSIWSLELPVLLYTMVDLNNMYLCSIKSAALRAVSLVYGEVKKGKETQLRWLAYAREGWGKALVKWRSILFSVVLLAFRIEYANYKLTRNLYFVNVWLTNSGKIASNSGSFSVKTKHIASIGVYWRMVDAWFLNTDSFHQRILSEPSPTLFPDGRKQGGGEEMRI